MPKSRSSTARGGGGSAAIGGGGAGAGAGVGHGSAGTTASLRMSGPFVVESFSASRNRTEQLSVIFDSPRAARVFSASGNVYQVTEDEEGRLSCDCRDFRYRGSVRPCRHIIGVNAARRGEQMMDGEPAPAMPRTRGRGFDASRVAEEARRRREEAAAAAARQAEMLAAQEPEVSLADDAAFQELYRQARQGNLPYEYENVLNGSNNTFGVEIEFSGGDRAAIARELYERGLIPEPRQVSYHANRQPGMWSFETDASVRDGGELVSPVFRDTPETWRQIEEVCEIVRRHGGRATASCGGHVHIGSGPLDHEREHWQRLVRLCRENEDLIYRIAAGGESRGRHRGTHYTVPLTRISTMDLQRTGHYGAVNARQYTVEFRYFNGTLDPRQIQANIRLAHGLMNAAANPATRLSGQDSPLGSTARRSASDENHSSVRGFLDNIFTRTRDKLAALWLYATSRWQTA